MPDKETVTPAEQAQEHDRASARHVAASATGHKHDQVAAGGRYVVNGQLVNADGVILKDKS